MDTPRIRITAVKSHPLDWLLEPLEGEPGYLRKKMFGAEAVYLNGRLVLAIWAGEEPWNGLLIATSREHHEALQTSWPRLAPHSVLGKWLYISQNDAAFESSASALVRSICKGDPRIGVEPRPKKRKKRK
jgi:hypothetical protein